MFIRIFLAVLLIGAPAAASAQSTSSERGGATAAWSQATAAPRPGGDGFRIATDPRLQPIVTVDTTAVDTVARVAIDLRVANRARSPDLQENGLVRVIVRVFDTAAIPGSLLLASALYGAGELGNDPGLAELGMDAGQAIVAAGMTSLAAKVVIGRARPHTSPDDPLDLGLGRGLRGNRYQSFPSAHTAAAFATAMVMADLPDRGLATGGWLAPVAFTSASLAGISRIYLDEHWATDVVAGALLGALVGHQFAN